MVFQVGSMPPEINIIIGRLHAHFYDGLGWSFFKKTSYVNVTVRELYSKFQECNDFSLKDWHPF